MKADVRVLCPPEIAPAFGLVGLRVTPTATSAVAEQRLRELTGDASAAVVLIEQSLHDAMPVDRRRQLTRRPLPMVVPFPGPRWTEAAGEPEAYIVELLRQVIGYRVRLR